MERRRSPPAGVDGLVPSPPIAPPAADLAGCCRHSISATGGMALATEAAGRQGQQRLVAAEHKLAAEKDRRRAAELAFEHVTAVADESEALREAELVEFRRLEQEMTGQLQTMHGDFEAKIHSIYEQAEEHAAVKGEAVEQMAEQVAVMAAAAVERRRIDEVTKLGLLLGQSEQLRAAALAEQANFLSNKPHSLQIDLPATAGSPPPDSDLDAATPGPSSAHGSSSTPGSNYLQTPGSEMPADGSPMHNLNLSDLQW